jgi:sortase A
MAKRKEKSNSFIVMIQRLVMLFFFLFGLSLLVYPLISQGINDYLDQRTVQRYQKEASQKNKTEIEKLQKQMALQDEKAKKRKKSRVRRGALFATTERQRKEKKNRLNPTLRSTQ